MGRRGLNLFVLLFVGLLLALSLLVITTKETKLGLDLSGGTELVYEARATGADETVTDRDIEQSINIIRERIDELGVAEPEVARLGSNQISVALPDVQNAQRAIEQVGTTAQLFFYDWEPNLLGISRQIAYNPGQEPSERLVEELEGIWDRNGREPNEPLNQVLVRDGALPNAYEAAKIATGEEPRPDCTDCSDASTRFFLFEKGGDHELLAGPETVERDLFTSVTGERIPRQGTEIVEIPPGTTLVYEYPVDPTSGETIDDVDGDGEEDEELRGWYAIKDVYALTGDQIEDPQQAFDQFNQPVVQFDFTDSGRVAFQEVTEEIALRGAEQAAQLGAIGSVTPEQAAGLSGHFAVVLDDEAVTRPIINFAENPAGIDGRTGAEISGGFSGPQEAQDIATFLQIGALPVELKLISQSQVSATLGQQALDQGLKAGLIGLALVVLFLLAYYRFLGLVAAIGLIVYAVFFFALMKLIPVTMTLPGIAGLILTIGVAADSNIVIFERIKEEVRAGRSLSTSIAVGYRRGIGTIIDANVITLLTAFILFVLATGGVKGFAFTLGIGVIVSLITAVVFTQAFLGIFSRGRLLQSPALLGAREEGGEWKFDFIGLSRWFFSFSGVILTVGALALATLSLNFGIDFESGTRLSFAPEQDASVEEVRTALEGTGVEDAEIQEVESDAFGAGFQIQSGTIQPGEVNVVRTALDEDPAIGIDPGSFENTTVGPTFGEQVARSAAWAIVFSLLLISAYVGFRFEGKYAVPVLIAVAHDILITAGVYSLSEREVTSATVAAFLTILGYSLYDTVIVFDRIRENVPRMPRATFSQIVNRSMSEVLTRSLITGLSSVFLVGVLLVFGGETLKDFAFAMMVGIFSGTYSSIFIASPVLTAWKEREPAYARRRARIEQTMGKVPAYAEDVDIARLGGEVRPEDEDEIPEAPDVPTPLIDPEPRAGDGAVEPSEEADAEVDEPVAASAAPKRPPKSQRKRRARNRRHGRNR